MSSTPSAFAPCFASAADEFVAWRPGRVVPAVEVDGNWHDGHLLAAGCREALPPGSAVFTGSRAIRDAYLWGWPRGGSPHPEAADLPEDYSLSPTGSPLSARRRVLDRDAIVVI